MRSLFYDIHRTVMNAVKRSGFSLKKTLSILGVSRSWYYSQLSPLPVIDGRFNPFAVRGEEEWMVVTYKRRHPRMSFREIAYTLIDEDLAYLSPGTVYSILKKHDLNNTREEGNMGIHTP